MKRAGAEKNEEPLMVYCQMWRELESFLHDAVTHEDPDYSGQAQEFLKLVNSIKRKYADV